MLMKKFTLFVMSLFLALGTTVAQESSALELTSVKPSSDAPVSTVDFIQLVFNKDVVVTLPKGGIGVKNNETNDVINLVRVNEYTDANMVVLHFEQKAVIGKEGKEEMVEQRIEAPGTYSYTIPAGCIKSVDNEEFPEQTFSFTVVPPFEMVGYTPNQGTDKVEEIQVTFNDEIASVALPASGLQVVDMYWTGVAKVNDYVISDDNKSITFKLDNAITTPGTYYLDIYQDVITSVNGVKNNYTTVVFNVVDFTPSFSTNINEGDKVKELNTLEITFNNVNVVELVEDAQPVTVYMPGDGEATGVATLADKKITVTFDQQFTEDGDYTFDIPAGMFKMDGVPNERRVINVTLYTVTVTPLEILEVTPAQGAVNEMSVITIKFNQPLQLSFDENWQQISQRIKLVCGDTEYILTNNPDYTTAVSDKLVYVVNAEWNGYEFASTPVTAAGTYTLDLSQIVVDYAPEQYTDEYGYPNTRWNAKNYVCAGSYSWTIADTAIGNIEAESGEKVIYDLTGRRVDAITNAGIYIVNGKKVIVK